MIKIIILIVCLFNFNTPVNGKTYYSDYSTLSDFSDTYIETTDLVEVIKERRYKFFEQEKNSKYFLQGANTLEYPNIDINDYIYNDFSEWSFTKVEADDNKIIETRKTYKYQEMDKVRYLYLTNVEGGNGVLRIAELTIKMGSVQLGYIPSCTGCSIDYKNYIKNGNTKENMAYIINGETMTIDLNGTYDLGQLEISLYLYDVTNTVKKVTLSYASEDKVFSKYDLSSTYQNTNLESIVPIVYKVSANDLVSPTWQEEKIGFNHITSNLTRKVIITNQYRYKEKMFSYYNIDKKYLDDYYVSQEGYIKDETLYKDYYAQRTREKIEIFSLELKEKESLKKQITCSKKCEIIGSIDYTINALYPIIIKTADFEIKENFVVNILDQELAKNNQDEFENKLKELEIINNKEKELLISKNSTYLKEIQNLNNKINLLNQEKKSMINSYEESINSYQNEIIRKNTNNEKQKEVLKSSFASTKNIIILLILLLILIILKIVGQKRHNL